MGILEVSIRSPCCLRTQAGLQPCVCLCASQYTPELDEKIARGEELPSGERESEIRAGAVVACEQIVRASNGRLSTLELDWYLWRVGTSCGSFSPTSHELAVSSLTRPAPMVFRQGAAVPRHRAARDSRHVLLLSVEKLRKRSERSRRRNRDRVHLRVSLIHPFHSCAATG